MSYKLHFISQSWKEWQKLSPSIRQQFNKKLLERLQNPHIPSAKLSDAANLYKIKLRKVGYRLVYRVEDNKLIVRVIAVGRRDHNEAYNLMKSRLNP